MISFHNRSDKTMEPINKTSMFTSRLDAAKYFAQLKNLDLKTFIRLFKVNKDIKN